MKNSPNKVDHAATVSIVIVSFNTRSLTLDCLESLLKQRSCGNYEIVVVDNDSSDGSADAICAQFGNSIQLIRSDQNLGFAAGCNLGAREATAPYLLFLNPDTVVLDNSIENLLEFADNNQSAGIWGGRTVYPDGTLNPKSCWKKMTLTSLLLNAVGLSSVFGNSSLLNPEGMGGWDRTGVRNVDIVSGCYFLIDIELWHQLGGFDDQFFMYGEEADLCLRAREFNASPIVTSDSTIIHYGAASEPFQSEKVIRLLRSTLMLVDKHFSPAARSLGKGLLLTWPLSRYLAYGLLTSLGNTNSSIPRDEWKNVWSRRRDWCTKDNQIAIARSGSCNEQ